MLVAYLTAADKLRVATSIPDLFRLAVEYEMHVGGDILGFTTTLATSVRQLKMLAESSPSSP